MPVSVVHLSDSVIDIYAFFFFSFLIYLFWMHLVFAICVLSLVAVRERTRIDDSGLAVLG